MIFHIVAVSCHQRIILCLLTTPLFPLFSSSFFLPLLPQISSISTRYLGTEKCENIPALTKCHRPGSSGRQKARITPSVVVSFSQTLARGWTYRITPCTPVHELLSVQSAVDLHKLESYHPKSAQTQNRRVSRGFSAFMFKKNY